MREDEWCGEHAWLDRKLVHEGDAQPTWEELIDVVSASVRWAKPLRTRAVNTLDRARQTGKDIGVFLANDGQELLWINASGPQTVSCILDALLCWRAKR